MIGRNSAEDHLL